MQHCVCGVWEGKCSFKHRQQSDAQSSSEWESFNGKFLLKIKEFNHFYAVSSLLFYRMIPGIISCEKCEMLQVIIPNVYVRNSDMLETLFFSIRWNCFHVWLQIRRSCLECLCCIDWTLRTTHQFPLHNAFHMHDFEFFAHVVQYFVTLWYTLGLTDWIPTVFLSWYLFQNCAGAPTAVHIAPSHATFAGITSFHKCMCVCV